jgi:hypothetical protein
MFAGDRLRKWVALLVLALWIPSSLVAQKKSKEEHETLEVERSASDAHSFMELFTKLERDWINGMQRKDKTALEEMVAPEFMVRTSVDPDHPVMRADWIQDVLTNCDIRSYKHRGMAIRAFLGVAIVSFVQSQQATVGGKDRSGDYLIVDLWVTNHGKWQAAARYIAPGGTR